MVITLGPELVTALNAQASRQGITPEAIYHRSGGNSRGLGTEASECGIGLRCLLIQ